MSQQIIVVGALSGDPEIQDLIKLLNDKDSSISWVWVNAPSNSSLPSAVDRKKLINRLRNPGKKTITIAMLPCLDGKVKNEIYNVTSSIVPVRIDEQTIDKLVEWIFSPEANLVPRSEWFVNAEEAALLALLSKLIRNKCWNKDQQGHQWLKASDLINQAPVNDPDRGKVRIRALKILPKLDSLAVLLTKGSEGGGGTKKEWSINTRFLPEIKRAIISSSLDPLANLEELSDLMFNIINSSDERDINALDKIINSTTVENCRESE